VVPEVSRSSAGAKLASPGHLDLMQDTSPSSTEHEPEFDYRDLQNETCQARNLIHDVLDPPGLLGLSAVVTRGRSQGALACPGTRLRGHPASSVHHAVLRPLEQHVVQEWTRWLRRVAEGPLFDQPLILLQHSLAGLPSARRVRLGVHLPICSNSGAGSRDRAAMGFESWLWAVRLPSDTRSGPARSELTCQDPKERKERPSPTRGHQPQRPRFEAPSPARTTPAHCSRQWASARPSRTAPCYRIPGGAVLE